jgi:phospholipid/cholesterol/gamma-HCH transport system ATP-binding protein
MKHLMGLLKPDAGQIYVDGLDIVPLSDVEMAKLRRKFGMVFQYAALFDSQNVVENIAFPLVERYNLSRDEIMVRVRELLKRLDLEGVGGIEQKFPAELSGGQRKRVGLARALIDRPEILLYDEPTTGLDPVATKNVDEMILRTSHDFGVTSVVISHDMASTFRIGDRVSMLYEGKILVTGTAAEVLHAPEPRASVRGDGGPGDTTSGAGVEVRRSWAAATVGRAGAGRGSAELLSGQGHQRTGAERPGDGACGPVSRTPPGCFRNRGCRPPASPWGRSRSASWIPDMPLGTHHASASCPGSRSGRTRWSRRSRRRCWASSTWRSIPGRPSGS